MILNDGWLYSWSAHMHRVGAASAIPVRGRCIRVRRHCVRYRWANATSVARYRGLPGAAGLGTSLVVLPIMLLLVPGNINANYRIKHSTLNKSLI